MSALCAHFSRGREKCGLEPYKGIFGSKLVRSFIQSALARRVPRELMVEPLEVQSWTFLQRFNSQPSRFDLSLFLFSRAGAKVPDDVAIVGYGNTDICEGLLPSLTTVDYRAKEVGQLLAEELLALIEGKVKSVKKTVRPFLVERESH